MKKLLIATFLAFASPAVAQQVVPLPVTCMPPELAKAINKDNGWVEQSAGLDADGDSWGLFTKQNGEWVLLLQTPVAWCAIATGTGWKEKRGI